MNFKNLINTLCVLVALCGITAAYGQSRLFSQYTGVMKHDQTDQDQLAKIDFIASREQGNTLHLKAILTLYFGDYGSKEYVSYTYEDVTYNLITGTLVFDQQNQDLTIVTSSFADGELYATIRSTAGGDVGELHLTNYMTPSPSRNLIGPLWGEYKGICDNEEQILQLQTFRTSTEAGQLGDPFGSYEIRGQVAAKSQALCPNAAGRPCVKNNIKSGSYNFFLGQLLLNGQQASLSCSTKEADKIACGACVFTRTSQETAQPRQLMPKTSANQLFQDDLDTTPSALSGLSGSYNGYLHHEQSDKYQAATINIVTFQDADGSGLQMSATATAFFGSPTSGESVTYRFAKRQYDLLNRQFLLQSDDSDALIQVSRIGSGSVSGTWYSRISGKVGTFQFEKAPLAGLPDHLTLIKSISGIYESEDLKLSISVRRSPNAGLTKNPFSSMEFGGYLYFKAGFARRIEITGGSYDFYSGRIGLTVGDGTRVATGLYLSGKGQVRLKFNANGFGRLLQSHKLVSFDQQP